MKVENALSEIVGALLLVALVIIGIGIVGVIMFSTPLPETKEKVVLSSSCMQCNTDSFVIVTRHEGGDVIDPQKMKFYLSTEYVNKTFMNRFEVKATYFIPAGSFAGMDKTQLCNSNELKKNFPYNSDIKSMKNGDVIVIWYTMDKNSKK